MGKTAGKTTVRVVGRRAVDDKQASAAPPPLFRWREAFAPLLQHLLFVLYSLLLAPYVIAGLERGAVEDASTVGWLILGALILEIPALHILLMAITRRLTSEPGVEQINLPILAWFAHMIVVIIMYMQALRALGLEEEALNGGWPMWLMPLLVIKELYMLFLLAADEGRAFGAYSFYGAQAVLLVFSCLVHTGFWGLMMHNPQFSSYSTVLLVMEIMICGFFFLIFYAAIQLPALKYVTSDPHGNLRRRWVMGLMLAGLASIWPFVELEIDGRYTSLEAASKAPTEVRLLALQQNDLPHFPEEIGSFAKLRKLYLFRNHIKELPPAIGRLHQLEHLSLGYNRIAVIAPEFGELRRLRTLEIYSNQLRSLPPAIGQLESLEELNASWNHITTVPSEICTLKQLRVLKLGYSQIVSLPPEIGQLKNLRVLDLSHNQLQTLPDEFYDLKLDELELDGNPLTAEVRARLTRELVDTKIMF